MKALPFLLILLAFGSCGYIFVGLTTKKSIERDVRVMESKEQGRTIVFLPIIHLGSEKYFKSVKSIIDSLHQEGYIVYYEGVGVRRDTDSLSKDTLERKIRKIFRAYVGNYKDSTNKSLPRVFRKNKYLMQSPENTGIIEEKDVHVDISIDSLIYLYEKDYGPIRLNDCDFETPLKSKYRCRDTVKYSEYAITHKYRDGYISRMALNAPHKKIVMLYGKRHWIFIYADLRDAGFVITQGVIARIFGIPTREKPNYSVD